VKRIRKPADRAMAYDAICAYALTGEEPDIEKMPDSVAIVFEMIKPNLVASRRKAESGKRGGETKQTASKAEAKPKQEKEQEKEQEQVQDKEQMLSPKPPRAKFTPPTVDEVQAYCLERGNGIDAQYFVDYYARQKWKLSNGVAMSDWKAAVRTWEAKNKKRAAPAEQPKRKSWADIAAEMEVGL